MKRSKQNKQSVRRRPQGANPPSKMFSYYRSSAATRASRDRPRGQQDDKKVFSSTAWQAIGKRFGSLLLGVFVLVCLVIILQLDQNNPKVKILNPEDNYNLHSQQQYRASVASSLQGSFANTNKVTINARQIVNNLEQTYPEIGDASLVLPLIGHRPIVYISLTKPVLVVKSATQNIVVDGTGRALEVASSSQKLSNFKSLPELIDSNNLRFQQGDVVLSDLAVEFIRVVLRQLEAKNIEPSKMILPRASEQLDFYPKGVDYLVKFNLHLSNARQQVGGYLAVRGHLKDKGITPQQYIDVRLPGRAYYR